MSRKNRKMYAFFALSEDGAKPIEYPTDAFNSFDLYESKADAVKAINRRLRLFPSLQVVDMTNELTDGNLRMVEPFSPVGIFSFETSDDMDLGPFQEGLYMLVEMDIVRF